MKPDRIGAFFRDLYHDLDDRHLLLPVLAVLVAIVAVPLVLKSDASTPAPPPASPSAATDATELEPAVLAEQTGIRNYRERLAALKKKNPFEQQYTKTATETSVDVTDASAGDASVSVAGDSSTSTSSSTSSTSSTSSSTSVASSGGSDPSVSVTDDTTVDETTVEDGDQPKPEIRFYAGRVDVTVGPLGETKELDNVRPLDFLPDDKVPVAAFIGLRSAGSAVFALTGDVTETSGEGSCAPKESTGCEYLTLKIGEERQIKLVDGSTYRLKLRDIHIVRIPDPRDAAEKIAAEAK